VWGFLAVSLFVHGGLLMWWLHESVTPSVSASQEPYRVQLTMITEQPPVPAVVVPLQPEPTPVEPIPEPMPAPVVQPTPAVIKVAPKKIHHKPIITPAKAVAPAVETPVAPAPVVTEAKPMVPAPTPIPAPVQAVSEKGYQQGVREALLKCREYPRIAKRMGVEGEVKMKFTVDTQGHLLEKPMIVSSSGNALLDKAALDAFECAQFPSFITGMTGGAREFVVPLSFVLTP
jgi:protein TonB